MTETLEEIGEFGFIDSIRRGCLVRSEHVIQAIGDDAAVFTTAPDKALVVTTDLLVEHIHFERTTTDAVDLGHKALAVNLSDIAAMGAEPREAFVSVAVPPDCGHAFLDDLYRGIKALAQRFAVNILGGDTTAAPADLVINVAVVGTAPPAELLYRHAAQAGDVILTTGFTGDSRAGLYLLAKRLSDDARRWPGLVKAHRRPRPHLREGRFLARCDGVHAAIDVSDGLAADLGHVLDASRKGAHLRAAQLPVSDELKAFCRHFDHDPCDYALAGGEDYVLLCTVARERAETVARDFQTRFGRPLFAVGEITQTPGAVVTDADGRERPLPAVGWDHFKTRNA